MTEAYQGIGANSPPEGDAFALDLEERNRDLWRESGELEKRLFKLPKAPATEEEALQITAWCGDCRALIKKFEERRVEVKAPYLKRATLIDETFGVPKKSLAEKATQVEQRNGPYLRAKREAEEARRLEEARQARLRQEEAERRAREAMEAERRARDEAERIEREGREREAQRIRDEEERRLRAARRDPDATDPGGEEPKAPVADNEAAMREAHQAAEAAGKAREAAEAEARKAEVQAGRAEKKADQVDNLGKVSAGGANQRANMVWVGRVESWPQVLQSLGPLAPFLNEQLIRDAVNRAARHPDRPAVPGVVFVQELAVQTTAKRS